VIDFLERQLSLMVVGMFGTTASLALRNFISVKIRFSIDGLENRHVIVTVFFCDLKPENQ
jgi:hypothetical protein